MTYSRSVLLILCSALILTVLFDIRPAEASSDPDSETAAKAINALSWDLYRCSQDHPRESLPFTLQCLGRAFHDLCRSTGHHGIPDGKGAPLFPGQDSIHAGMGALQQSVEQSAAKSGIDLNIANALWGQKGYGFVRGS